jgi:hypothetical protein
MHDSKSNAEQSIDPGTSPNDVVTASVNLTYRYDKSKFDGELTDQRVKRLVHETLQDIPPERLEAGLSLSDGQPTPDPDPVQEPHVQCVLDPEGLSLVLYDGNEVLEETWRTWDELSPSHAIPPVKEKRRFTLER